MKNRDISPEVLTLGRHYKQIRERRGYAYADIATDYLHTSQISRFEKGENMFSAECLLLAIEGLNMTPAEFFALMPNNQPSSYYLLLKDMNHYAMVNETNEIENLLKKNAKKQIDKIYNIIIKLSIAEETGKREITTKERQYIYNYLTNINQWTVLDIQIFSSCLGALELEEAYSLGLEIFDSTDLSNLLLTSTVEVKNALVHLYMHLVYEEQYSRASRIKTLVDKLLLMSDDIEAKLILYLFDCLAQSRQNKDSKVSAELENAVRLLQASGVTSLAKHISYFMNKG